jgi:transcription factor WhiB
MHTLSTTDQDRGLSPAAKIALEVAADATLETGAELDEPRLQALMDAAEVALTPPRELDRIVTAGADCRGFDTEDFYPRFTEDPTRRDAAGSLSTERQLATALCQWCPVRAHCLALSYTLHPRRYGAHGVWGGLGARDRTHLRPLWDELVDRLTAQNQPAEHAAQVDQLTEGA